MSIAKDHIPYVKFVKNEVSTFGFLQGNVYIQNNFPELAYGAQLVYNFYKGKTRKIEANPFEIKFNCRFDLQIEKKPRKIFIEFRVRPNYSEATYMLGICESEGEKNDIIRKFHFDFALPIAGQDKKPVFHLQYGGESTPLLDELKVNVQHLQPWLSVPRISYTPINLALLLDMVFTEFVSEKTKGISERKEWRQLVKNNEDQILVPYYSRIYRFLTQEHLDTNLLRDFCYGG